MEKKTIHIDHNILDSIILVFVLAILAVFAIEHFSTFSYIPNLSTPNIDNDGKLIVSGTYNTRTTLVGTCTKQYLSEQK